MSDISRVKVTLGLKYDGAIPDVPENSIGHLITGPHGFLRLLETQLGVFSEEESFTTRLIQYLACLETCNTPDRFYHNSYAADPFSVARTLLQWRDQWYMAGWQGEFEGDVKQRLADMAVVEKQARDSVAYNLGQRIQQVLALLADHIVAVDQIELHDALEHFPVLWRTLIQATNAPIINVSPLGPQAGDSDLGQIQRLLSAGDGGNLELKGDATFLVIEASAARESAPLTAHIAQQWLAEGNGSIALLSESRGVLLDEAMEAAGSCRLGFSDLSPWRPVFQVLPLALELLWTPLNATALFQFLSHPVGPIPARIRGRLAQCVANTPGIGSGEWQKTVADCLDAEGEDKRESYREAISYWLEPERFDPQSGMSCTVLAGRAKRVSDWLIGLRELAEDPTFYSLYAVALNQVTEFINAVERLKEYGRDILTQDNVRRLIEDVRGTGSPLIDRQAEVMPGHASALRADHAGSFNVSVDQLIWWDCQATDRVHRWPWNRSEHKALAANGVNLQSEDEQLAWLGEAWLRPILSAKDRCILVIHADTGRHHPIWDQISTCIQNIPIYALGDPALLETLQVNVEALEPQMLPSKVRWWQLTGGADIPKRSRESYSSLDSYIYSPYQWLLRYAARLFPGSLTTLAEGNQLKGNLAHRLFEEYFFAHHNMASIQASDINPWVDDYIYSLLQTEGATLLEAGQQADCERFISQVKEALSTLVLHLQEGEVVSVDTELHQSGFFTGGELTGYIDILATRADGSEAVVDIKWGGINYRRESLQNSSYLQLATYAHFRSAGASKSQPALSFFIINGAWMLSLKHNFFPNAESIRPANEEGWGEFWRRFEHSWRWRREQLDRGLIEVTATGTEPTEDSAPGEEALAIPETSDKFSDYTVLTGWESDA